MATTQAKKTFITDDQKRVVIPTVVGFILLSCLGYIIYYTTNQLKQAGLQVSEASRKKQAIERLQTLKAREQELLTAFPRIQKKNDIIEEIAGWARKEGLDVTEIEPKEVALSGTNFRQLTLTLSGKGSYIPITRFLKRIESSTYFLLASGLQLAGYEFQRAGSRFSRRYGPQKDENELNRTFKIVINVFFLE